MIFERCFNVLIWPSGKTGRKKVYFNNYCGGPIKLSRNAFNILIATDFQLITAGSLFLIEFLQT